jgi:hypothetical protein
VISLEARSRCPPNLCGRAARSDGFSANPLGFTHAFIDRASLKLRREFPPIDS